MKMRIMPIGDSITRGSYLRRYHDGPFADTAIGLPNPDGGGWRKGLQDRLREAGIDFEFVGELTFGAYGQDGKVDDNFDPHHHGLAGFGNRRILSGGMVPTPPDVLAALGVSEVSVPDLRTCLARHRPDLVLLLSGANGFDAEARNQVIDCILGNSDARLFVATIPPQCPPRHHYELVQPYNASLPETVERLQSEGKPVQWIDLYKALDEEDLLPDGVHPNGLGMQKIAEAWWEGLRGSL